MKTTNRKISDLLSVSHALKKTKDTYQKCRIQQAATSIQGYFKITLVTCNGSCKI